MQLETGHPICSLCKREITSFAREGGPGATPSAKLCEGCRGLIQTAFHRVEPRAVAASAGAQISCAATSYVQSIQTDASTVVRAETSSPGFFEDFSAYSDTPEQSQPAEFSNADHESFDLHFEDEPSATLDSEAHSPDAAVHASTEHQMHFEDEPSAGLDSEANSLDAAVLESTEHHDETFVASAPMSETMHSELNELHNLADDGIASDRSFATAALETDALGEQVTDEIHNTQSITEAAPADPWEDPLPAWDYSRSEWPVLMGPPRGRSFAKFKVPFAVMLILAFGAGFYYLIYPQISRDQPLPANSVPPEVAPEPRAATQNTAEAVQPVQGQTPSTPSDAPASEQAQQPQQKSIRDSAVAGEPVASETGNAQGRFALQAAAFPTQAGADEFAEKLKSAGVPSYVVSADLARRGRWFRVRVGRFNTAEEAQRFAGEAQLRAKGAGMSLQLIVSQYDQP